MRVGCFIRCTPHIACFVHVAVRDVAICCNISCSLCGWGELIMAKRVPIACSLPQFLSHPINWPIHTHNFVSMQDEASVMQFFDHRLPLCRMIPWMGVPEGLYTKYIAMPRTADSGTKYSRRIISWHPAHIKCSIR